MAELLTAARQAHTQYRQAAGRIDKDSVITDPPRLTEAGHFVQVALSARLEADALDPQHTDLAWQEDATSIRTTHDSLVNFYGAYLTPVEARGLTELGRDSHAQ